MKLFGLVFISLVLFGCRTTPPSSLKPMDTPIEEPSFEAVEQIIPLYTKGKKVLVIVSPSCRSCEMALDTFSSEIKTYLKTHGVFVAPIPDVKAKEWMKPVRDWNSRGDYRFHLINSDARLPQVRSLKPSLQFFFFNEGHLVEKIKGWSPDTQTLMDDAIQHLERS